MKKSNLIFISVIALLLFSFTLIQINTNSLFEERYEDIGTIKQSILKPELFNITQKGVWVLLDGRELDNRTELYTLLEEGYDLNILKNGKELPDARGKFIRSSNYLGKGSDPDSLRLVGSLQLDDFKRHTHKYLGHVRSNHEGGPNTPLMNQGPSVETEATGGDETRPINISMYTYIKVAK